MRASQTAIPLTILCTLLTGLSLAQSRPAEGAPRLAPSTHSASILTRDQTAAIMPATVFYRGQSASIQARNSAGIHFKNDRFLLAAMVDTSGYSSGIAQTYQAYLITEVPLRIGDKMLSPGAYGFGFLEGDRMILMDLGGNELLHTSTTRDPGLARPTPLQILPNPSSTDSFRLYLGRSYVLLSAS